MDVVHAATILEFVRVMTATEGRIAQTSNVLETAVHRGSAISRRGSALAIARFPVQSVSSSNVAQATPVVIQQTGIVTATMVIVSAKWGSPVMEVKNANEAPVALLTN
jgi:hypothetical protein